MTKTTNPSRVLATALRTAIDPATVDAWKKIGYTPTEKQARFHASTAHACMFGGAMGAGKSRALTAEALRAAWLYPGIRVGCFRRSYDELAESFLVELADFDYAEALGARWNKSTHNLTFANKSVVRFRYCATVEDAKVRQGGAYQLICFDESGMVMGDVIEALEERQRTANPKIPVLGLRLASNPGDVGHAWLKARFIDSTDYGRHLAVDAQGRSVEFIPARAADNPYLDAGYDAQLAAISDPERRRAVRDGDWDIVAGAMFSEWDRERHVVKDFKIPEQWRRLAGVDYGYSNPFAVVWLAIDPDGRAWLYRELYATKVGEREQARMILAAEKAAGEKFVPRFMDPAAWGQTGDALSPAVQYCLEGCGVVQATNDRLSGASRFHTYLSDGPACAHHRQLGWTQCPLLHVFESCVNWIATVPPLPRDPKRPEDVLTTAVDHLYDATRYGLMAVGLTPGAAIYSQFTDTPRPRRKKYLVPREGDPSQARPGDCQKSPFVS